MLHTHLSNTTLAAGDTRLECYLIRNADEQVTQRYRIFFFLRRSIKHNCVANRYTSPFLILPNLISSVMSKKKRKINRAVSNSSCVVNV